MDHSGQKRNPFCIPFIDKWYPGFIYFIYFIYFAMQIVQRKKERKNYKTKMVRRALNKNLWAFNIRLPQLQLMMATHAQL